MSLPEPAGAATLSKSQRWVPEALPCSQPWLGLATKAFCSLGKAPSLLGAKPGHAGKGVEEAGSWGLSKRSLVSIFSPFLSLLASSCDLTVTVCREAFTMPVPSSRGFFPRRQLLLTLVEGKAFPVRRPEHRQMLRGQQWGSYAAAVGNRNWVSCWNEECDLGR